MPVARGQELVAFLAQERPGEMARYPVTDVQTVDGTKLVSMMSHYFS